MWWMNHQDLFKGMHLKWKQMILKVKTMHALYPNSPSNSKPSYLHHAEFTEETIQFDVQHAKANVAEAWRFNDDSEHVYLFSFMNLFFLSWMKSSVKAWMTIPVAFFGRKKPLPYWLYQIRMTCNDWRIHITLKMRRH